MLIATEMGGFRTFPNITYIKAAAAKAAAAQRERAIAQVVQQQAVQHGYGPPQGQYPGSQLPPSMVQPAIVPSPHLVTFPDALLPFPEEIPWFKKPAVIGGIAAGVLVLGAGGYMLSRR